MFNVGVTFKNVKVLRSAFETNYSFSFSKLSLVCAFIGNLCRFLVLLDPRSTYGIIKFTAYEMLNSLNDSFHVISSLSSVILWFDMIASVEAGLKLHFRSLTYAKNKVLRTLFVLIAVIFLFGDLYISYFGWILEYDPYLYFATLPGGIFLLLLLSRPISIFEILFI